METKMIKLDGAKSGIAVESITESGRKFVKYKNEIRLFKNLELAKVTCRDIVGGYRCRYYIIHEGKKILMSKCYCTEHSYHYIDQENQIRYIFMDDVTYKATTIGYLVFEDGDTVRCDKKYGFKRQKQLMNYVADMLSMIVCDNGVIDRIERTANSDIIVHVKNTTGRIHILSNSRLMDINQERKLQELRCIPFLKEMDKFTTLYLYAMKNMYEPLRIETDDILNGLIDQIVDLLKENIPETLPKFIEVEYSGYINMED